MGVPCYRYYERMALHDATLALEGAPCINIGRLLPGVKLLATHVIISYLIHHGYIVLFAFLAVELIGLPMPGELLMSYAGYLVYQGKLAWIVSIMIASLGIFLGITVSYFIGSRLGYPFFKRYGHYVHITPQRLQSAEVWYEKYGSNLVLAAYFIPGIRHVTGYFAGIIKIPYRLFAVRAYAGALIWASFFITLGKVIGPDWNKHQAALEKYLVIAAALVFLLMLAIFAYKYHKENIRKLAKRIIAAMLVRYDYSRMHVFLVLTAILGVFFSLVALMLGLIQDYLANEFVLFDAFATYLVGRMFYGFELPLRLAWISTQATAIVCTILVMLIILVVKSKMHLIDIAFLIFSIMGGEITEEVLRMAFHRLGPVASAGSLTFPGEQTFMSTVIYGYFLFILFKYIIARQYALRLCAAGAFIIIVLLAGFNRIYYVLQYPSDVLAGCVFGGVWLIMNLVILECVRLLKFSRLIAD